MVQRSMYREKRIFLVDYHKFIQERWKGLAKLKANFAGVEFERRQHEVVSKWDYQIKLIGPSTLKKGGTA